jgi:phage-related protein
MAGAANVMIKIGANAGNAIGEIGKVNKALGDQMTTSQKASVAIRKAAVPAGLALAALGAAAISCAKAAAEDEAAQVKLAGVLERTAGASDAAVKSTEDFITKLSLATGVADDQLRPAMAKLATATGDVKQAQEGLATALDISAATGKSVDSVSSALAKAYAGNTSALAKLIPGIDKAKLASGDFATIQKELSRLTGGAAAEAAGTAAGQYKIFQLTLQETQEEIGMALLPVLKDLAPILVEVAGYVKENSDVIFKFAAGVAAVAGAVVAINAIMSAWNALLSVFKIAQAAATVAQIAFNIAVSANPIGLIIIAIAALVAGLILAYRESETFRRIVDTVWAAIKTGIDTALRPFIENWDTIKEKIQAAWDLLKRFWPILLPGGAFYVAIKEINDRFGIFGDSISAVKSAFGFLEGSVDRVKNAINNLWDVAQPVFRALKNAIVDYLNPLKNAFEGIKTVVEAIVSAIARIKLPSINIPGYGQIGGNSFSGKSLSSGFSSQTINVTINGPIDADSTAREIRSILSQYDTRYAI